MANITQLKAGTVAVVEVTTTAMTIDTDGRSIFTLYNTAKDSSGSAATADVFIFTNSGSSQTATAGAIDYSSSDGKYILQSGKEVILGPGIVQIILDASATVAVCISAGGRI